MIAGREVVPYRLALRTRFRGLCERRGCLISGSTGWGEFAPFADYSTQADARWLAAAIEQADGGWPEAVRGRVDVNAIIPAVEPAMAARMAAETACATIKIKVGDGAGIQRVAAVRGVRPDAALRVDVNGAWDLRAAAAELAVLAEFDLEYAEQPVRTFDQMRRLRDLVDVPLAADEVIRIDRRLDDVAEVADVAVLKVAPLGGVAATLRVAHRVNLPTVISSALDSSMGLAAGLAAACALPETPLACGLGTGVLLAADTTETLRPVAGRMHFAGYPAPDPHMPRAMQDMDYWRERLARAADLLTERGKVVE